MQQATQPPLYVVRHRQLSNGTLYFAASINCYNEISTKISVVAFAPVLFEKTTLMLLLIDSKQLTIKYCNRMYRLKLFTDFNMTLFC